MSPDQPPIRTQLLSGEAGSFDVPPGPDHVLTIHASGVIAQRIACEGPLQARTLRRGEVDVIPAGAPLRLEDEGRSKVLALVLPRAWATAGFHDLGLDEPPLKPLFSLRDARLEEIAWRLHRRSGSSRWGLYDDCLALEALRSLHRAQQPAAESPKGRTRALRGPGLRRVLDYIEAHLDEPITLQDLALEAGLGPTAFKSAFRQALGASAHRYVVVRRAERARLLLLGGELPPSQVALEAGFSHQSHMARWLRRLFGLMPSQLYRSELSGW